jgi:hypothetical protein
MKKITEKSLKYWRNIGNYRRNYSLNATIVQTSHTYTFTCKNNSPTTITTTKYKFDYVV